MGGPKNENQIKDGVAKGCVSIDSAKINFIVNVLFDFKVSDIDLSGPLSTGILNPILDALQAQEGNEFMMCADVKKVTAGVDIVGGDVDKKTERLCM